jgi:hypothetical protein
MTKKVDKNVKEMENKGYTTLIVCQRCGCGWKPKKCGLISSELHGCPICLAVEVY